MGEPKPANPAQSIAQGIRHAGPLALSGLAANGANVIVTVVIARFLTTREYGLFAQLIALFLIVSMPGSALVVAVVRRSAAMLTLRATERLGRWAHAIERRGVLLLGAWVLLVLAIDAPMSAWLGQEGYAALALMLSGAGLWVLLCVDRGLLQSCRAYNALSVNLLVEGGVRTVGVLGFVVAGMGVTGAALGVFLAELATAIHARIAARRQVAHVHAPGGPVDEEIIFSQREIAHDMVFALVAMAMLAVLQNVDVITVSSLGHAVSGSYAAISVASKAIVFAAVVLGSYLLPEAALRHHEGEEGLHQVAVVLVILAVPAVALLAVALLFPHTALSLVFSHRYLGAASAFVPLVVAMICLAVTMVLTTYQLARARRSAVYLLVGGSALLTLAVLAANGDAVRTAQNDLAVQALLLVAMATSIWWERIRASSSSVEAELGQVQG